MNRLANAFSTALPSAYPTPDPSTSQPRELHPSPPEQTVIPSSDRLDLAQTLTYDDPRSSHWTPDPTSSKGWGSLVPQPRRPDIPRNTKDREGDGIPGARNVESDKGVRVNLFTTQGEGRKGLGSGWGEMRNVPGGGRLSAVAIGPQGKYAVGGGQFLKVVQVEIPRQDGVSAARIGNLLGKGSGGSEVREVVNLWRGSWGPQKGVSDLAWGSGALEHKIVTAAPSGSFLVFDLHKPRLEREQSGAHSRPINRVLLCQSLSHSTNLLTGGTEGSVKLWDLRERDASIRRYFKHSAAVTSLCFAPDDPHGFLVGLDHGAIYRYDSRQPNKSIGRNWGAHGNKPVMDLKWKPEAGDGRGSWLASGGTDRTVQIWDMTQYWGEKMPAPVHSLHTALPLSRIAWRPKHETELVVVPMSHMLASSSSIDPNISAEGALDPTYAVDDEAHIEVWDVRRHHVAKYALHTQHGMAADVAWHEDGALVTAFQHGEFGVCDLHDRTLPLEGIPRQVMGWSAKGEVTYAVDRFKQGEIPFDDLRSEQISPWNSTHAPKSISDPPFHPVQALGQLPLPDIDEDAFAYMAQHYKLEGLAPENLCIWNREVAEICGRPDDARLWTFLMLQIEEFAPSSTRTGFNEDIFNSDNTLPAIPRFLTPPGLSPSALLPVTKSPASPLPLLSLPPAVRSSSLPLERVQDILDTSYEAVEDLLDSPLRSSPSHSGSTTPLKSRFAAFLPPEPPRNPQSQSSRLSVNHTVPGERSLLPAPNDSRLSITTTRRPRTTSPAPPQDAVAEAEMDYPDPYGILAEPEPKTSAPTRTTATRGSAELAAAVANPNLRLRKGQTPSSHSGSRGSPIPRIRPGSQAASPLLVPSIGITSHERSSAPEDRREELRAQGPAIGIKGAKHDSDAYIKYRKNRSNTLLHWWQSYVDDAEVQLATALFVIGTCVIDFPQKQCERLAHSYVELLERYRLPVEAAYVRRFANVASLEMYASDDGATRLVHCERCGRSTGAPDDQQTAGKRFWWCRRCKAQARICTMCHRTVKGLWMGCGQCQHGGHQRCMRTFCRDAFFHLDEERKHERSTLLRPSGSTVSQTGTSYDSSGVIDRSRTSGEFDHEKTAGTDERLEKGWTVCPAGCGCRCRRVVRETEVDPG